MSDKIQYEKEDAILLYRIIDYLCGFEYSRE